MGDWKLQSAFCNDLRLGFDIGGTITANPAINLDLVAHFAAEEFVDGHLQVAT